jgi:hypothetical protein
MEFPAVGQTAKIEDEIFTVTKVAGIKFDHQKVYTSQFAVVDCW